MMDVRQALEDFDYGTITYPELVRQFQAATFTVQQPLVGVANVYTKGEEDNQFDAPAQLASAEFAETITAAQEQQLLDIYTANLKS